jgi:starvation-inducible outer membrane lipoprotein
MKTTLILIALALAGCATPPQAAPFERCMDAVGHATSYESDKLKVAEWCSSHNNGGIQ